MPAMALFISRYILLLTTEPNEVIGVEWGPYDSHGNWLTIEDIEKGIEMQRTARTG